LPDTDRSRELAQMRMLVIDFAKSDNNVLNAPIDEGARVRNTLWF